MCHFNLFQCAIQWYRVHSDCCAAIPTVRLQNFLTLPKRIAVPTQHGLPSLPAPAPWHPPPCPLSLGWTTLEPLTRGAYHICPFVTAFPAPHSVFTPPPGGAAPARVSFLFKAYLAPLGLLQHKPADWQLLAHSGGGRRSEGEGLRTRVWGGPAAGV